MTSHKDRSRPNEISAERGYVDGQVDVNVDVVVVIVDVVVVVNTFVIWSSPSPNTDFERFKLASDMLPPFSTPPDNSKLLSVLSNKHNNKKTVKSIKIDTDFTNSHSISIQDDLIFDLE